MKLSALVFAIAAILATANAIEDPDDSPPEIEVEPPNPGIFYLPEGKKCFDIQYQGACETYEGCSRNSFTNKCGDH
ncbi:predicted protein [Lichtheimia corymbifera JMRC:FSU:9682]|uniref:Uncharacterized protein n=1 Tax=Lichtheimia corymbifera JMRC:FSU:9682 TaxID=1263082 RepID=A0A068S8Z6_9FUNG|nr:predicted protein [Lichtheimia corymbifera JMRC:FSU:9682]